MMDGNQNIVASYKYDAWGNDLTDPQSPIPNPFKYVGGLGYYSDKDSGLKLLGVRYYDSQIGRFWSFDPIKKGGNWYKYVENNPIVATDPKGLDICPIPLGRSIIGVRFGKERYVEIGRWEPDEGGAFPAQFLFWERFFNVPPVNRPCYCFWKRMCQAKRSIEVRIEARYLCFSHRRPFVYVGSRTYTESVKSGYKWICGRAVTLGVIKIDIITGAEYCECPYPSDTSNPVIKPR